MTSFFTVLFSLLSFWGGDLPPEPESVMMCDASFTWTQSGAMPCSDDPVMFTSSADPNTVVSYMWNFGIAGGTSTNANPTYTYPFTAGTTSYTASLTITDTAGVTCTTQQQVTLMSGTPIFVTADSLAKCIQNSPDTLFSPTFTIDFTQTPSSLGPFTWDFGDGTIITSSNQVVTHTYDCYGTFILTVTANGENCPGYQQQMLFYTDPISDLVLGGQPVFCENETVIAINQTDPQCNNVDFYTWDWGFYGTTYTVAQEDTQSFVFNLTNVNKCLAPIAGYVDAVQLTAHNACFTHFSTTQITIRPAPIAEFSAPDTVCLPDGLAAMVNTSCPLGTYPLDPSGYLWDFGDGSPQTTIENPIHDYTLAGPGIYTVTLNVDNNCGADVMTQDIVVVEEPVAAMIADTNQGCAPFCMTFQNLSTPDSNQLPMYFQWNVFPNAGSSFGAGTNQNSFEPVICFSAPDTFLIQMIAWNRCNSDTTDTLIFVNLAPLIQLDTVADTCDVFVLDSLTYTLNDFGSPISDITWTTTGLPSTVSDSVLPPITFQPGSHSITLTVINECGPTSSSISFEVDALPVVDAGPDQTICINDSLDLNGTPDPGFWTGTGVVNDSLFIPPSLGVFELVYTHEALRCFAYDTVYITVLDTPAVQAMADTALCEDSSVVIQLNGFPLGGTWTGTNVINGNEFIADTVGTFVFTYSFTDSIGCPGRDDVLITVHPKPIVDIMGDTALYCLVNTPQPLPAASPLGGTWTGPGVVGNQFNPGLLGGPDTVGLTYSFTTAFGCTDSDTVVVVVVVADSISAGPGDTLCFNYGLDTIQGANPGNGIWSGGAYIIDPSIGSFNTLLMSVGANQMIYTFAPGTSCETNDTTIILIQDTLTVDAGPDEILCESTPAFILSGFSPAGGTWTGVGITNSTTGAFDPALVPVGTSVTLMYEVIHPNGCVSRDQKDVFVDVLPVPAITVDSSACTGDLVLFSNQSTGGTSFFWDFGDNSSSVVFAPTHAYVDTGLFVYQLIVSNTSGCQDSVSGTILIIETPEADFSLVPDSGCAPLTVSFIDQSAPSRGTYFWDFGNGDTSTSPNPPPITYQGGSDDTTYIITLCITNPCSTVCHSDTVTVFPIPQVSFGPAVNTGCSIFPVDFGNGTLGNPDNFFWYLDTISAGTLFSTDSIPQTIFLEHLPDTGSTVYTVYLIATNSCGADTGSVEITVLPNTIDAFFNTDPISGCAPLTVQFQGLSGAPNFGWLINGSQPTVLNPTETFTIPGTYTAYHYANNGCSFDTNSIEITVFEAPQVSFSPDTHVVCAGVSVDFTNTSTGTVGYNWDFGDNIGTSLENPTHIYFDPGTYTVTLTAVSDTNNCPNTFVDSITVLPTPDPSFFVSDTVGCPPVLITTDSTTNNLNYFWTFGDGATSILQHPTYQYTASGTFILELAVTDNLGCIDSASAPIRIFDVPAADFAIVEDTLCGSDALVEFQNLSIDSTTFASYWLFGDGDTSILTDPTHIYDSTGQFMVELFVSNPFGCEDSAELPVWILPQPQAVAVLDTTEGCVPLQVDFLDQSTGNSEATWFVDGQIISSGAFSYTFTVPDTIYEVILVADTADFCLDSDTVFVETSSEPVSAFTVDADQHCDVPTTVQFTDQSTSTRPLTYLWDFGDSNGSTQASPSHTYSSVGEYIVSLTVSNDFGCVSVSTDTIYVHPQPVAQIGADTTFGCVPLTVNFTDLSAANSHTVWTIDGQIFTSSTVNYIFTVPDTVYEVVLVVDTANFCFDQDTILIQTSSLPIGGFFVDADRFCDAPATVQFTDTSLSTRPLSFSWDFGDGNGSTIESPAHTYQQVGEWIVTQVITNDFGCTDTRTDTIFVYPQPVAQIGADTTEGCVPLTVQFSNLSTGYSDWEWLISGGPNGLLNPSFTYTVADTDLVVLMVDTADFCFDTTTVEIRIANPPQSAFTVSQDQFCAGPALVQFTDMSQSEVPITYLWTFGDGNSSTAQNPSHSYLQVGEYVVTQYITNSYACVDSSKDTIFVYPNPQAALAVDTMQGCVPFDVTFTDQSTNATNWQWTVDGMIFSSQNFSYTFTTADTSYVIDLVVDTAGFCFDTTTIQIDVASPPLANFGKDWDQFCDIPALNVFTDQSQSTRPLQYNWSFGDGGTSVVPSPNYVYQTTGIFAVGLEIINDYNCRDTLIDTVQVLPQPVAQIQATPERGCAPMFVAFLNQSQNYSNSLWDFGDGSGLTQADSPSHLYTQIDQSFIVQLIVDTARFCYDTTTIEISVASAPVAEFSPSLTEACGSAPVDFTNLSFSADQPLSYLWDFGNGQTSSLENPSTIYEGPGDYLVQLIARNAYGCEDTFEQIITIIPQAEAMFVADETEGCQPFPVRFTSLSSNATILEWDLGDGSQSTDSVFTHEYLDEGVYDVRLTVSYDGKCADEITFEDFITVYKTPIPDFFAMDSTINERFDGTVVFTNRSIDADRYEWDFGDGLGTESTVNPVHRFPGNQTYQVSLTAYLGICDSTIVKPVTPNGFGGLYIPNAFAPLQGNGDYAKFYPKGVGLTAYHVGVYTIWGDLVWESKALDADGRPSEWWDGRINGELANSDVFVWRVHEAVFEGNIDWPGPNIGDVTLIR